MHGDAGMTWRVPRTATLADLLRWETKDSDRRERQDLFVSATVIGNVALDRHGVSGRRLDDSDDASIRGPLARLSRQSVRLRLRQWPVRRVLRRLQLHRLLQPARQSRRHAVRHLGLRRLSSASAASASAAVGGFGMAALAVVASAGNRRLPGGGFRIGGGGLDSCGGQGQFSHRSSAGRWACRSASTATSARRPRRPRLPLPGLGLGDEVVRRDFADSAFWTAKLRTDATGKATTTFKLPDSLTNWRVQVTAVSPKMHVGTGDGEVQEHAADHDLADAAADVHRGRHRSRVRHRPQPDRQGADDQGPPEGRERRRCSPTPSRTVKVPRRRATCRSTGRTRPARRASPTCSCPRSATRAATRR